MKKKLCMTALILLLLTGCAAKTPNSSQVSPRAETPSSSTQSERSDVSSQSHHDEVNVQFMNSMGCADKTCTDASHFHHCPTDCKDYDHYHACSLDCTETSHHHSGHTTESSHKEQQHSGSHSGSHHK